VPFFFLLALLGRPGPADQARRDLWRLTGLTWLVFAAYVVKVGGDFMGLYRFILPVLPFGAVVVQESVRRLAQRLRAGGGHARAGVGGRGLWRSLSWWAAARESDCQRLSSARTMESTRPPT